MCCSARLKGTHFSFLNSLTLSLNLFSFDPWCYGFLLPHHTNAPTMPHLKSNTPMSAQMGIYKMWALPLKITASVWKLGSALDLCNVPLCTSHRAPRVSSECPEISVQTFNTKLNGFNFWIICQLFSRHNVIMHSCYRATIDFLVRGKYEPLSQEGNWLLVSCDEQLPAVCRKESRNPVNHSAQSWDEGCPKVGTWTGKVHAHTPWSICLAAKVSWRQTTNPCCATEKLYPKLKNSE